MKIFYKLLVILLFLLVLEVIIILMEYNTIKNCNTMRTVNSSEKIVIIVPNFS